MEIFTPPFNKGDELNKDLAIIGAPGQKACATTVGIIEGLCLLGYPRVLLNLDSFNFLEKELLTQELDTLAPHLWLVATQRSDHISALHHQLGRGRTIIVTENPKLHLVWINNCIYIKPIPSYLLNHAFWVYYFTSRYSPLSKDATEHICQAALGFLRTYAYLIEHESDFRVAKEHCLIPSHTTWTTWNAFVSSVHNINDSEVSARYRFGELRLSRLNFWSKIFLGRMNYFQVTGQTSTYLASVFAPLVFVWATCNVILAAMQVVVSVQALYSQDNQGAWAAMTQTSRWFSVTVLVLAVVFISTVLMLIFGRFTRQLSFAAKDLMRKRTASKVIDEKAKDL